MRFKLASLILVASCIPTMVMAALPAQGTIAVVSGRAHVEKGVFGTYIEIESSGIGAPVTGIIPFGNQGQYPDLANLEGRRVAISGVIYWDGRAVILLTTPDQLDVAR